MSPSHPLRAENRVVVTQDWRTQLEVKVTLYDLPPNTETRHIFGYFGGFGNITLISIRRSGPRHRDSADEATVTFRPPPAQPFWNQQQPHMVNIDGRMANVAAVLKKASENYDNNIPSPCRDGVHYPRETTVYPTSMHFGFYKDPTSIMAMKTVSPTSPKSFSNASPSVSMPSAPALRLTLDLHEKKIKINFPVVMLDPRPSDPRFHRIIPESSKIGEHDRVDYFRMDIRFSEIGTISKANQADKNQWALVIYLPIAPCFWKANNFETTLRDNPRKWGNRELWRRSTHAVYVPSILEKDALSLRNDFVEVDFGRWTTYMLTLDADSPSCEAFQQIEQALGDFNIPVEHIESFNVHPREPCKFWQILDGPDPQHDTEEKHHDLSFLDVSQPQVQVSLPWEVRYQLESCISHGILNEHDMSLEFLQTLADVAAGNLRGVDQEIMELFQDENMADGEKRDVEQFFLAKETKGKNPATKLLESIMDPRVLKEREERGKRIWDPMTIFSKRSRHSAGDSGVGMVHYCTFVRKALVTPTAISFKLPSIEVSNRINRQYSEYGDFFLRIQFGDEHGGRIYGQEGRKNDEIWARVFDVLKNGIKIGDRIFQYLACGNSQMRESGAHLFCPTNGVTPDLIRSWMGDFADIKIPAKYSARLGQCFSTTRAIRSVNVETPNEIPDIAHNGYTFTDGVGKISHFLALLIAEEFNLKTVPSAFQIRLGGLKGMLAVWPGVGNRQVQYRPSQKKFDASSKVLEVVRTSQRGIASLNRQIITILEALGVDENVFLDLQEQQLRDYDESMTKPDVAVQMLGKSVDQNNITTMMADMVRAGFMDTRDPFLLSLLHLWKAWSLKQVKEKARIVIDKGTFAFGVVDELGVLKGHVNSRVGHTFVDSQKQMLQEQKHLPEIFVQVSDRENPGQYKILTGVCVTGRNPSLHPGDLRVVMAVDKSELHHLKDVIVFPSVGDRPLPHMCSGGDLDGDDFFVFWDERLIPKEWNHKAMNYDGPAPKTKDQVKVLHLIQFFVQYMKNDSLARIAHAHLAHADLHSKFGGPKHRDCLELADLHSRAVDYAKTGAVAEMPQRLAPKTWPHFMEKAPNKTRPSRSVLGKLYDRIMRNSKEESEPMTGAEPEKRGEHKKQDQVKRSRNPLEFCPEYETPFDKRVVSKCPPNHPFLSLARKIKSQYDAAMRRLMGQREIKTEFEVFTAFVMSKPRNGSDYELQGDVGMEARALKQRFRKIVIGEVGGNKIEQLAPFVMAMYLVTQQEVKIALHEASARQLIEEAGVFHPKRDATTMPLISFPWIFDQVLCVIAKIPGANPVAKINLCVQRANGMEADFAENNETRMKKKDGLERALSRETDLEVTYNGRIAHLSKETDILGPLNADSSNKKETSRSCSPARDPCVPVERNSAVNDAPKEFEELTKEKAIVERTKGISASPSKSNVSDEQAERRVEGIGGGESKTAVDIDEYAFELDPALTSAATPHGKDDIDSPPWTGMVPTLATAASAAVAVAGGATPTNLGMDASTSRPASQDDVVDFDFAAGLSVGDCDSDVEVFLEEDNDEAMPVPKGVNVVRSQQHGKDGEPQN
ncbi:RNA dependent RNA polymerase-domain-containing protein [Zalerion maritima]|uniref:RNA-directed RNA polymerase n=1 Tax=Zalerion maritima TaxID=339359 RepID=A0AAD5RSP2_9PEZI|nr:RNA dependent RNA polymerase-domain-containing protein [Zalerion maritima]